MVYLSTQQCVDACTAWKYDERETDDCADDKAELHYLAEQRRTEIHQDIADNLVIIERNIAKETHLQRMPTFVNMRTHTVTLFKIRKRHK